MLLRKLRNLLSPPPASPRLPYGITPAQLTRLRALRSNAEWQDFAETLDTLCTLYGEELLGCNDAFQMQFLRGFVLGLRKAGTFIDETLKQLEQTDARKRNTEHEQSERRREQRAAAVFGTGFFT